MSLWVVRGLCMLMRLNMIVNMRRVKLLYNQDQHGPKGDFDLIFRALRSVSLTSFKVM